MVAVPFLLRSGIVAVLDEVLLLRARGGSGGRCLGPRSPLRDRLANHMRAMLCRTKRAIEMALQMRWFF